MNGREMSLGSSTTKLNAPLEVRERGWARDTGRDDRGGVAALPLGYTTVRYPHEPLELIRPKGKDRSKPHAS